MRIAAVKPKIDKDRGFVVVVNVIAKSVDDVNTFMENLEKAGVFTGLLAREDRVNDQGLIESTIETGYTPGGGPRAPRSAGRGGAPRR